MFGIIKIMMGDYIMINSYEKPVIEIVNFSNEICTSVDNDEVIYLENTNVSSGGWLPWI